MKIQRPLNLFDVTCLGVNTVIGSSIFLFPGRLAGFLGPASVLSFAIVGLLLIAVGLCFAEAASYFDRPGGSYLYTREAFGPLAGFGIGWMCWVTQVLGWAAVANGIAVYLGHFGIFFTQIWVTKTIAISVILLMGMINYRGVKLGAWVSNFFTAAKLLPLLLIIVVGLGHFKSSSLVPFSPKGYGELGAACFLSYFAFQGFESVPVPSGEVGQPRRVIPLAVTLSLVVATLVYLFIQAVSVSVNPHLATSERPLADVGVILLGPVGGVMIALAAAFSMIGYNAGTALASPRYLLALSQDSHLPKWFAAYHPRFQTPYLSVVATTAVTLVLAISLDFNRLVDFSNVVVTVQYVSTCATIPILRKMHAGSKAFRLPGGLTIPIVGIAATVWLGTQGGWLEIGWALAALTMGFGLKAATVGLGEPSKHQRAPQRDAT